MIDASLSVGGKQGCHDCVEYNIYPSVFTLGNEAARSVILSLSCHCPLSERGCNWRGDLGNCANHLDTCGYVYEACSLECGVVLSCDELKTHVDEMCDQR